MSDKTFNDLKIQSTIRIPKSKINSPPITGHDKGCPVDKVAVLGHGFEITQPRPCAPYPCHNHIPINGINVMINYPLVLSILL